MQGPAGQWIATDLAAVRPSSAEQRGLPDVFLRTRAHRLSQPGVESAKMDPKHPTHRADAEHVAVGMNEGGLHPLPGRGLPANHERGDSRAKDAVAGSTGQRNGSLEGISGRLEARRFPWSCVEL